MSQTLNRVSKTLRLYIERLRHFLRLYGVPDTLSRLQFGQNGVGRGAWDLELGLGGGKILLREHERAQPSKKMRSALSYVLTIPNTQSNTI